VEILEGGLMVQAVNSFGSRTANTVDTKSYGKMATN
jgi:hypothetical protein